MTEKDNVRKDTRALSLGCVFKEVRTVKLDHRLLTGLFVGMVIALHYSSLLMTYFPLLVIATIVLVLKTIHR